MEKVLKPTLSVQSVSCYMAHVSKQAYVTKLYGSKGQVFNDDSNEACRGTCPQAFQLISHPHGLFH
jgi:hypothetical protein